MKIPDVNVLLYAVNPRCPQHLTAKQWFETNSAANVVIAYPWSVILGFVRICTRRGIFESPLTVDASLEIVRSLLSQTNAKTVDPTVKHMGIVSRLLLSAGTAGNLTTDAHLAALAIEHEAELASFDADFQRFAGLSFKHLQ